jgi:hypothetical protein
LSWSIAYIFSFRRYLEQSGEEESVCLEGDIGGGLVLQRHISILKDNPKIFQIDSSIQARNVGAGSGGFSRLVCLRVHPTFTLLHPTEVVVAFTAINGSKQEISPESGVVLEGDMRPDGKLFHVMFDNFPCSCTFPLIFVNSIFHHFANSQGSGC